jgi:hypothetical protein
VEFVDIFDRSVGHHFVCVDLNALLAGVQGNVIATLKIFL